MSDADYLPEPEDSGVKKSFWDHLRDLRTSLLRSAIAIGLALIVCLLFADKLVMILEYPLKRIDLFQKPKPSVVFRIGDTQMGPYVVDPEKFKGFTEAGGNQVIFQIGVGQVGDQQVATLNALPPEPVEGGSLRVRLHNLSPTEAFFVAFRVALYGGIIVASPFWIYYMGQFFLPALSLREKSMLFQWFGWGLFLFLAGVLMTYFILMPIALRASVEYSQMMGFEAYDWRADEYIRFVTKFIVGMGIGFQFPVIVLLLVKMGFLTHHQLAHYRRHVVVLSLVLGALLTTPEVITQIAMAIPLYILYEISILIAKYWDWKDRKAEAEAA